MFILFILVSVSAFAGNGFAIKTIVIDAGHGGKDPGAIGPDKTNEKDVALAVALKLGKYIEDNFSGVNVIYTRKTDVFIELYERADIANKNKADLFIAIHCNSNNSPSVYGTSTYVLGLHRTEANLEVAKRENSVILLEDDRDKNYEFDPNTPEGHIIMSMKQNAFLDQSIDIASKIESQYEGTAKRKSLGVKQAGFYVIYKTAMPSLLSEIGFISNPTEEKFLNSEKGQDQIASSLFKAFKDYKFEMENSEGEQFAYEEAKRKAETADTGHKTAPVATTNNSKPVVKEVKPATNDKPVTTEKPATNDKPVSEDKPLIKEKPAANDKPITEDKPVTNNKPVASEKPATVEKPVVTETPVVKPAPAASEQEPDNITATLLSGRKIRKPIDNASGGGISPEVEKPVQPAPVKTEPKPVVEASHSADTEVKKEVKPTPKPVTSDTATKKPVVENKPVKSTETEKPVTEPKKVTAGNSHGATIEAEKPVSKPAVTETKPVKAEPKPVETKPVVKTEDKPVKVEKKPVETEATTKPAAKPAPKTNTDNGAMTFKVQLIALKGPMKAVDVSKVTKALGEITDETIPSGLIRYYSGNSTSYAEAKNKLAAAATLGYKDAFIVGFKNGVRFGPEKLKALENQ